MAEVIARVHSVHLVNVEQRQAAADPQTKAHDLGCESACFRQLSSTTTITIFYYYSARKLILIYRPTEGRRLSWPLYVADKSTTIELRIAKFGACEELKASLFGIDFGSHRSRVKVKVC